MIRSQTVFPLLFALVLVALVPGVRAADVVPSPPGIGARAHLLQDFHSGRILSEANADERLEPASLTKMMTSYVVFAELARGQINLDDRVRISEKAWRMTGSRTFVEVGEEVPVEALLKGVIVQSGNDASVALAEYVAGDESSFADLMNQYARRLGMTGTHFVNSSGLPHPDHYTTARDMARIAEAMIRDYPEMYAWHAIREYEYNGIKQYNRNRLLWRNDAVDGIKTGYTESAGYCLVTSAERDGMRLVSVVMGADSPKARTGQSQALLRFGFRFYETHRLYAASEPLADVRVWQGEVERLGVGVPEDVWVTVPRGQYSRLDAKMELESRILAPVARGQRYGTVRVTLGDEKLAEQPLISLRAVGKGNVWRRVSDYVRLLFQ